MKTGRYLQTKYDEFLKEHNIAIPPIPIYQQVTFNLNSDSSEKPESFDDEMNMDMDKVQLHLYDCDGNPEDFNDEFDEYDDDMYEIGKIRTLHQRIKK